MGDEYIRFHRAFRQLADRLCNAGFPVLRFDFYGCGDSGGDCGQGQLQQWRRDISTAIAEIRRRCDVAKVGLVGLRLGASLSMIVGAEQGDIDCMVLCDSIIHGRAYFEELQTLHRTMLQFAHVKPKRRIQGEEPVEILGFSYTDAMLRALDEIDLLAIRRKPANTILVIDSHVKSNQRLLNEHLQNLDAQVEYQYLPHPQLWTWTRDIKVLVPHQILQAVVSWMEVSR